MKKILSMLLVLVLAIGMLAGCKKEADNGNGGNTSQSSTDTGSKTDTGKTDNTAAATTTRPDTHVVLKMYLEGSNVTDDTKVLEEVNKYLDEKLNCELKPIWGTWGDFDQGAVLSLQGAEDVDIYFTCSWTLNEYNQFARDGYYVRLDKPENNLIEKYGQDIQNLLPEVLIKGATIEGADGYGIYAVNGYKDIACQLCWDVNVDLLKKYGYTVEDIEKADYFTFGDILAKVKAGEGENFYPLLIEGAVLERMVDNSIIVAGDSGSNNLLSYYINPKKTSDLGAYGNKILNKFATDEFKKFCEKTREYYLAGYIDPDMANPEKANDVRSNKQLTGQYLIGTQSYSLGYEIQASTERGFEVAMVPTTPAYVDTTSSQGAMMAISTASKNPDRAMMFLNLLNTDPYLFTLLDFGVQGIHYNLNEIGEVEFTPERDNYMPWTNGLGNVTLLPPQKGQGADFQTKFKNYYGNADEIPILGFTFNPENVENEFGALANVAAEYFLPLCTGAVDPAEKIPDFLAKLEANGMQKVVDEANKQLSDFLAAQGK
ncbi:MAG: ABC transporter substrate-binding protein [Lachnospiraceae bacterium]|nr:ABC transporter substrate-binding protein [Lachnospiraceae bacterium]